MPKQVEAERYGVINHTNNNFYPFYSQTIFNAFRTTQINQLTLEFGLKLVRTPLNNLLRGF